MPECHGTVSARNMLFPFAALTGFLNLLCGKQAVTDFNQGDIVLRPVSGMNGAVQRVFQRKLELVSPSRPASRPCGRTDRRLFRKTPADKKGFELTLLPFQFRFIGNVRIGASGTRIRTACLPAQRGACQDFGKHAFGITFLFTRDPHQHRLSGDCAAHETDLSVRPSPDGASAEGESVNLHFFHVHESIFLHDPTIREPPALFQLRRAFSAALRQRTDSTLFFVTPIPSLYMMERNCIATTSPFSAAIRNQRSASV